MAGDWIKIEHVTPDKAEVVELARLLAIDQDAVVGKLLRVWIWVDQHSVDGNDLSVTEPFLDRLTFQHGFATALRKVGWLSGTGNLLAIPNFNRHNGQTAKARGVTAKRVARHRVNGNAGTVTSPLQKPLPEKRREEDLKAFKRLRKSAESGGEEGAGEDAFMLQCRQLLGKGPMEKDGGIWRTLYRQNPGKAQRVIAEVEATVKDRPGTIHSSRAAFAMDLWKRFK
jgi:hypothetical protein